MMQALLSHQAIKVVANRTGLAPGKTVEEVERRLIKFVPEEFMMHAHHWLILHGRYTCKARVPDWDQSHDLVLEGHGHDPDQVIRDDELVQLDVQGGPRRFSSVPKANFG